MRAAMILSAAVTVTVLSAAGEPAAGQCVTYPAWGERVDADYTPNANGRYRFFPNVTPSGYNFAVIYDPVTWARRRIPMADPTILQIGDWYYATGTTDAAYNQSNFAIYKSLNLVDWHPHMLAFNERCVPVGPCPSWANEILKGPFGGVTYGAGVNHFGTQGQRVFRQMWAPHLYRDPADNTRVYLAFTAVEGNNMRYECNGPYLTPPHTCFVSWMDASKFVAGGTDRFGDPAAYGYKVNNADANPVVRDGGVAQGPGAYIPVSLELARYDECNNGYGSAGCGNLYWLGGGAFGHDCQGAITGMSIDPFVYFDTLDTARPNRRWMLYNWADGGRYDGPTHDWDGLFVAAFPMWTNTLMDSRGTLEAWGNRPYPMAYRNHDAWWPGVNRPCTSSGAACPPEDWNTDTAPDCWLLNGSSGRDAQQVNCGDKGGVAEGGAAFARGARTYVLYSRNSFDSPAYGIFYRVSSGAFGGVRQADYDDNLAPEQPLVMSVDRAKPRGWSYGHGEVFAGPTVTGQARRYYLVFHAKEAEGPPVPGNTYQFPSGYSGRTVYFKELNFNPDGTIAPISNNRSARPSDSDGFIVPAPGYWNNPPTPPVEIPSTVGGGGVDP
jgi:hypothetical protein